MSIMEIIEQAIISDKECKAHIVKVAKEAVYTEEFAEAVKNMIIQQLDESEPINIADGVTDLIVKALNTADPKTLINALFVDAKKK